MLDSSFAVARRYRAFISYSHRDARAARWLHGKLERYRVPGRLVGKPTAHGPVPPRLAPIFRDRDELPAATDLGAEVEAALSQSSHLLVLCSPDSARSPWVNREIELFRQLNPSRPIIALIVGGKAPEAFPPALFGPDGTTEPLAADLAAEADGPRLAFLKVVAGLTALPLDALVQRDAQRRLRRVMAVTAMAVIAMLGTSALAIAALRAEVRAVRERAKAEALIEFMLTNLHQRLEAVGRLDVMEEANRRAFHYYEGQRVEEMSAPALIRRAVLLHQRGETELARKRMASAERWLSEAYRSTAALVAARPEDPERVFAHAQSAYWLGAAAYEQDDLPAANRRMMEYAALAERLAVLEPGKVRSAQEIAYATSNMCVMSVEKSLPVAEMLPRCERALRASRTVAAALPSDEAALTQVGDAHAWLADAYVRAGRIPQALAERQRQSAIAARLRSWDPKNAYYLRDWLTSQRATAKLEARLNRRPAACRRITEVVWNLQRLAAFDNDDRDKAQIARSAAKEKAQICKVSTI